MITYGRKACWDSKIYYDPQDAQKVAKVSLYQWIPLALAFQALLFKLPHVIWLVCHGYSGVSMSKIQRLTQGTPTSTWTEHGTTAAMIARYVGTWLQSNSLSRLPWRFLTILVGVVKLLHVINVFSQISMIDHSLLPGNGSNFGYHYIEAAEWLETPGFPHRILCDFDLMLLSRVVSYSVQCILPINEFNEQVYCFVSVWLLFVSIVTTFGFLVWVLKTVLPVFRTRYLKKLLTMSHDIDGQNLSDDDISTFGTYLGEDGVMVLKMIGENSSELMVSDIVVCMWKERHTDHSVPPQQPGKSPGCGDTSV
ncbi:hypothetical protein ScPMuIL_003525 [Solemya velum]